MYSRSVGSTERSASPTRDRTLQRQILGDCEVARHVLEMSLRCDERVAEEPRIQIEKRNRDVVLVPDVMA